MNYSFIFGIIIILIYLLLKVFIRRNIDKRNEIFLKLSFIFLFIILFTRVPISDLKRYILPLFKYLNSDITFSDFMASNYEFLFKVFNYVIGHIWLNTRFYILIVSIVTLIGPYTFIKRYSNNYLLSVLLYLAIGTYYMNFFIIQQSIAISIVLFATKYIDERKPIKFILSIIAATLFHSTAIIFLPVYLICNRKYIRMNKYMWAFILFVVFISRDLLSSLLLTNSEYASYEGTKYAISNQGLGLLLLNIGLIIFCLLFYRQEEKSEKTNMLFNFSYLCILIQIISTSSSIFLRLSHYFNIGFVVLVPYIVKNIKAGKTRVLFTLLLLIFIFAYLYILNPLTGYETILFNE